MYVTRAVNRFGRVSRDLLHAARRRRLADSLRGRPFIVELQADHLGLGAVWLNALYHMDAFKSLSLAGDIWVSRSPYSGTARFDPLRAFWTRTRPIAPTDHVLESEVSSMLCRPRYDSFDKPSQIWRENYRWTPAAEQEFSKYLNSLVGDSQFMAVHYRGTDKSSESPIVDFDATLDAAENARQPKSTDPILVFSDDPFFLEVAQTRWGDRAVIPTNRQPADGRPIHFVSGDAGPAAAWDAAFAVYAMSRSIHLVKTPSTLSGFVRVLRPKLPISAVGSLRRDFSFFPDQLLHRTL